VLDVQHAGYFVQHNLSGTFLPTSVQILNTVKDVGYVQ